MFSSAKETTTLRHNHISHDLMEALQMLKFSFKHGSTDVDFSQGLRYEEEVEYLSQLNFERTCVPEDINSYISTLTTDIAIE